MKKLHTITFFALACYYQSTFTMNDDTQKIEIKKIIVSFLQVSSRMQIIQSESHSGPVTLRTMAELMTNQFIIDNILHKQPLMLHVRNEELLSQVISINVSKSNRFN